MFTFGKKRFISSSFSIRHVAVCPKFKQVKLRAKTSTWTLGVFISIMNSTELSVEFQEAVLWIHYFSGMFEFCYCFKLSFLQY